jgi:GT2 family glycosyltransferase
MSQPVPDVSIILVSWNTRDLTLQCLASLPDALGGLRGEVWVVDNGSRDGSVLAIRTQHPDVRVIANVENVGFAAANNQAMRASSGRYALLLNTDTVASPGSIAALVRFADEHPRAGLVGPMLLNPDGSYQGSFARRPSVVGELLSAAGLGVRLFGPWYPNYGPDAAGAPRRAGYIQGAAMLARREAFEQVGLMDDGYFMYSEEPDWCLRMARARWETWYTPEARITHLGGQSTRQRRQEMVVALYRSKVRYFAKHHGAMQANLFCVGLLGVLRAKRAAQQARALLRPGAGVGPAIRRRDLQPQAPLTGQR